MLHGYSGCVVAYTKIVSDPNFVRSVEKDDKIYFFFREDAVENINCGKVCHVWYVTYGMSRMVCHVWYVTYGMSRMVCHV